MHSVHSEQSPERDPPQGDAIHGQQGHQALLGDTVGFPHLGGDYQWVNGIPPSPLRVEIEVLKGPLPLPSYTL